MEYAAWGKVNLEGLGERLLSHVEEEDLLCQLFSVSLVPGSVLDLHVEVEGALGTVRLYTGIVRTIEVSVNLLSSPSEVTLTF